MSTESPESPSSRRDPGPAFAGTDSLVAMVYNELKALAGYHMARERINHTLQPTALVHEVYLRLAQEGAGWVNRAQFMCVAARQIRRVLVDHARAHKSQKRGGSLVRVTLSDVGADEVTFDFLELNDALERLGKLSERDREIVELKYFAGLREPEIADLLGIGVRTVRRRWAFARAWLFRELNGGGQSPPSPIP